MLAVRRIDKFMDYVGVVDTQILGEEAGSCNEYGPCNRYPLSLGGLVSFYGLYRSRISSNGKPSFVGAHNGGNDAIADFEAVNSRTL